VSSRTFQRSGVPTDTIQNVEAVVTGHARTTFCQYFDMRLESILTMHQHARRGSALNRLRYFQRVRNLRYTARKVPAVRFFGFGLDQRCVGGGSRLR